MKEHVKWVKITGGPDLESMEAMVKGGAVILWAQDSGRTCQPYRVDVLVEEITEADVPGGFEITGNIPHVNVDDVVAVYCPNARSGWICWTWYEEDEQDRYEQAGPPEYHAMMDRRIGH